MESMSLPQLRQAKAEIEKELALPKWQRDGNELRRQLAIVETMIAQEIDRNNNQLSLF